MKAFAIVGQTGTGKTTFAKKLAHAIGRPLLVYDVNAEWGGTELPDKVDFLNSVKRTTGHCVVIEDATIFFDNHSRSAELQEILIRKRHTQTTVILLFHNLRCVPLYVVNLLNNITLLKTNDTVNTVAKKFAGNDELLNAFFEVNNDPDPHAFRFVSLV